MRPVSPVVPGSAAEEVVYARHQPQYLQLPAHRTDDGVATTRWRGSLGERIRFLLRGDVWLTVHTYNRPLQPVKLSTTCPVEEVKCPCD